MNEIDMFIATVASATKRSDSYKIIELLTEVSGYPPRLVGSMIGFGRYHYKYKSGREGDSFVIGFSPRKQNIAVYIMPGFATFSVQLANIGKHKLGKSCLYINQLADVDVDILKDIAAQSIEIMRQRYDCQKD